jgi:hypothetical protein
MRRTNIDNSEPKPIADVNCPYCRGKGYMSGLDYMLLETLGNIDGIISSGQVVRIPKISVSCPLCFPDGISMGDNKRCVSLKEHGKKIIHDMPFEYFKLLCTLVYLNLHLRKPKDRDDEWALALMKQGIDGSGESHLLPQFVKMATLKPLNPPMIKKPAKEFGNRLSPEQLQEKRKHWKETMDRMVGDHDYEEEEE